MPCVDARRGMKWHLSLDMEKGGKADKKRSRCSEGLVSASGLLLESGSISCFSA